MISPRQYAEKIQAQYETVLLWLRQGLVQGATRHELPTGGWYYLVPVDAPKPETRRGPKTKAEREAAAKKADKKARKGSVGG